MQQRSEAGPASEASSREGSERVRVARALLSATRGEMIDGLARLAAEVLEMPYAQVSILTDRQIVAGVHGLALEPAEREGPSEDSVCSVTVAGGKLLAIGDATLDERVAGMRPVTSGLVRAYLGTPIVAAGQVVGALCVYGPEERTWDEREEAILRAIGEAVETELELGGVEAELAQSTARLDLVFAAADIGSFEWSFETDELLWDDRLRAIFGYADGGFDNHIASFRRRVHEDDAPQVEAAIDCAIRTRGEYSADFRVVHPGGKVRWVAARGRVLVGPDGTPESMLGAAYDITESRDSAERVARVLETMGSAFYSVDAEWRFTYVNAEAERLLGRSRAELVGRGIWDEFPEAVGTVIHEEYLRAVETGRPTVFEEFYIPLDTWFELRAWPSADGLGVFFLDIDERVEAERSRQRASERLTLLSDVGTRLSATLETDEIVRVLADVFRPPYADQLAVVLREDEPAAAWQARLDAAVAVPADEDAPTVLSLISRGRITGAAVVTGLTADPADRRLLGEVLGRAAVALDNAAMYTAEQRVGRELQQLLLPAGLPDLPGILAAARYLPGTAGRDVGGDFYIAHAYPDGRLLFVIGDVMGHGVPAAARMGQLRAVVAAYAFEGHGPAQVLKWAAARTSDMLDLQMATVLVALHDPAAERMTIASAGHPPPLLAPLDGPPAYVPIRTGPPLGVGLTEYEEVTVRVPSDSTVVLYTDGLVETRGEPIDAGLDQLREALIDVRLPPEEVADHVLLKLGRASGGSDDIALLVFSDLT